MRIDSAGKYKIQVISQAETFFKQQFPEGDDAPDTAIQRHLMQVLQSPAHSSDAQSAELCLRCFISHQVFQVCLKLETQFGERHGFTRYDLFPYVLNDTGEVRKTSNPGSTYQAFALHILQTFNPDRSNLSTWTTRLVKYHPELNAFLLEKGVYLISDWALLNDTTPKQLHRILSEFHQLSASEVEQAYQVLESYHAVYRRDRLKQRQAGIKSQCLPPTPEQLQQMAQRLNSPALSAKSLMAQLHTLSDYLREYRVYVRGGFRPSESLDNSDTFALIDRIPAPDTPETEDEQAQFLQYYRQQLLVCLDEAVVQVTRDRVHALQRKDHQKAQQFVTALQLFHCQGQSMSEIAKTVGLQAQYQVTRLLNLKPFRADIRQTLLESLRHRILDQAKVYADPDRLQTLNTQLDAALDEQIGSLIQEAEAEASTPNRTPTSLLSRKVCAHLDTAAYA